MKMVHRKAKRGDYIKIIRLNIDNDYVDVGDIIYIDKSMFVLKSGFILNLGISYLSNINLTEYLVLE